MDHTFSEERTCPACSAKFTSAQQKEEYAPVIVIVCPSCSKLLWRPGFDQDSALVEFDPNANDGI